MVGYVGHAVRRGLEHASAGGLYKRVVGNGPEKVEVPSWGVAIMVFTFITFIVVLSSIEYTLKDVVATLAMVETPSAAITVSAADSEDPDAPLEKDGLLESGPTITLVHQKPITSKIRGTLHHLTIQAGRSSRWRGLGLFIVYTFSMGITTNFFDHVIPRIPGRLVVISAISGVLLSRLHAAWTHTVISMPSNKRFYKRVPATASWKQLYVPAAVKASAGYVSAYLGMGFIQLIKLDAISNDDLAHYTRKEWCSLGLRLFSVAVFALWCALFIVLPATVTLVRVEASILPEEDETIVPFDRTFSGKVVPKVLGGTGAVGFVEAWRTFNWEARRRLIKLYLKIFLIMTTVLFVMMHVLALEFWAIMGPAIGKFIAQAQQGNGVQIL